MVDLAARFVDAIHNPGGIAEGRDEESQALLKGDGYPGTHALLVNLDALFHDGVEAHGMGRELSDQA